VAELSKDIAAGLAEFLQTLPEAPKGPTPEAIEAEKKRAKIKAKAFKSARFGYYIVGHKGAYSKGRLYKAGELIKLPLDQDPSVDFQPATQDGAAVADAEEVARLRAVADAANSQADAADELDDVEPEADAVDDVEEEPAATPPAAPAAKKKAAGKSPVAKTAPAAKKKPARAADTDVE